MAYKHPGIDKVMKLIGDNKSPCPAAILAELIRTATVPEMLDLLSPAVIILCSEVKGELDDTVVLPTLARPLHPELN